MKKSIRKPIGKRQTTSRKIGKEYEEANHRRNHAKCERYAHICNFIHNRGNVNDTDLKA